jgi:hypothetical protein
MKIGNIAIAAGALALGLATWTTPGKAQGPMWDRVNVNLPYTVTIGDRTLQPGEYTIQQMDDPSGGSRVLLIYSDNGMKFQTSAMTIPCLDPNTARDTRVILHHFGNDYYFDKIWVQGKDYGYEFPLPNSVKAREKEALAPVSVAATYSTIPAQNNQNTTNSTTTNSATTAQSTPSATQAPATTQSTVPPATTQATTTTPQTTEMAQTTTGQNTMPPATTQQTTNQSEANREAAQANNMPAQSATSANRTMPATSAGWLMMLLSGGALSGAGLSLRRKR